MKKGLLSKIILPLLSSILYIMILVDMLFIDSDVILAKKENKEMKKLPICSNEMKQVLKSNRLSCSKSLNQV